eukprot:32586-Hanusia_phi.AAC.1
MISPASPDALDRLQAIEEVVQRNTGEYVVCEQEEDEWREALRLSGDGWLPACEHEKRIVELLSRAKLLAMKRFQGEDKEKEEGGETGPAREGEEEEASIGEMPINCIVRCDCCFLILQGPHALHCGHTLCESCWSKVGKCPLPGPACRDAPTVLVVRRDGGRNQEQSGGCQASKQLLSKPNLTLSKIVEEFAFPRGGEATSLRKEANKRLGSGDVQGAVELYDKAIELSPYDHALHGNKAQALLSALRFSEALQSAEKAVTLMPDWGKGHFRRLDSFEMEILTMMIVIVIVIVMLVVVMDMMRMMRMIGGSSLYFPSVVAIFGDGLLTCSLQSTRLVRP